MSNPLSLFVCVVLGAVLPLAFAPYYIWPIAIVAPAILFALVDRGLSARQLFLHGWMFGNGYFGFGVYWTYNSLHDFGQAPPLVAAFIAALLVMVLAVFPALALSAWQFTKRSAGEWAIWLLPIFWFAFEWLRGWFLTGMPWISIGYAHTESPLSGFAPLVGVFGVSAISILLSVILLSVYRRKHYWTLALAFIVVGGGFLLQKVDWTEADGKALKVTMVQGNIPQEIKWRYEQRQNIFNVYWRETVQNWDSDLIVWPETALPGRSEDIEQSILLPVSQTAAEQGSNILTGVIVSENDENRFYNSMLLLGEHQGIYHKRHLVLFGEYYPLRWLLDIMRNWINIPYSDLTPGPEAQSLMAVNGVKLGISICFEDAFSRDVIRDMPDANVLVNASNDAWFGDSLAPHQHLQMAQMRAIEMGRPMVRSTNTGISAFIDAKGRIEQMSEQFKIQSMTQMVQGSSGITPFYYFFKGQGVLAILIIMIQLVMVIRNRRVQ